MAEQVRDYLEKDIIRNAVNVPSLSGEALAHVRPYLALAEKLGRMHGQLRDGAVDQIEIEYSGEAAAYDVAPMTIAVLKGLLESSTDRVNFVNAPVLAQERGIKVVESKTTHSQDFASAIRVQVRGGVDRLIVGAVFHGGQPRIVRVDDFMLEAIPEGPTLFLRNRDEPGVVGAVGTILGEGGVNISRMQLALKPDGSEAAMLVNIGRALPDDVLARLRGFEPVISASYLDLGP